MAHRIYLMPSETDPVVLAPYGGLTVAPKYIGLLGKAVGNISVSERFFIVKALEGDITDFVSLEAQPDVIRLDQGLTDVVKLQLLEQLGIDVSGIIPTTPETEVQKRIIEWLDGRADTDFRGLNKIDAE